MMAPLCTVTPGTSGLAYAASSSLQVPPLRRSSRRRACPISCSPRMRRSCLIARRCSHVFATESGRTSSRFLRRHFGRCRHAGSSRISLSCPRGSPRKAPADPHRRLFWTGWGFRSDAHASDVIQEWFGVRCVPLALADPRFYHLDTAFCALPCGGVLYYPGAFTATALETIQQHVMPAQRILLDLADATRFAANAVCLGRVLLLSSCSDALQRRLEVRGYTVAKTPLRAFLRSGGSASCLTLRLDHQTQGEETFAVPVRPLHCENHSA